VTNAALAEVLLLPATENCLAVMEHTLDHEPLTMAQAGALWRRMAAVTAYLDYGTHNEETTT
jgi:hypothetical protein